MPRKIYFQTGGFDERFRGWGGEDLQFALDFSLKGYAMIYALDIWSEHQVHPRNNSFYQRKHRQKKFETSTQLNFSVPAAEAKGDTEYIQEMLSAVFRHYYPQDRSVSETMKWFSGHKDAVIYPMWVEQTELIEQAH